MPRATTTAATTARVAILLCGEAATPAGFDALERLDIETANIAAAGRWLLATDRVAELMAFFRELPFVDPFNVPIAATDELGAIVAEAIERPDASSHLGFPEACYWEMNRAFFDGDMATWRSLASRAHSSPYSAASAVAIYMRAPVALFDGDAASATRWGRRAVDQARLDGDQAQLAFLLGQCSQFEWLTEGELGLRTAEDALAVARTTGSPVVTLHPLVALTSAARHLDPERALAAATEVLRDDATQRRIPSNLVRGNVAGIRVATGQIADGLAALRETLHSYDDAGERSVFTILLSDLAALLAPIDQSAAADLAALAEGDAIAPFAAFGRPDLAGLAEERPVDVASARARVAKLSPDDATALVFSTIERLIAEHGTDHA